MQEVFGGYFDSSLGVMWPITTYIKPCKFLSMFIKSLYGRDGRF